MARRRSAERPDLAAVDLPEKLAAGPVMEVWLAPHEMPPTPGADLVAMNRVKRRFRQARQDWAAQVGVSDADMFRAFPDRRPRFADPVLQRAAFGSQQEDAR